MRVVAIYGKSGTGKSTSALSFAYDDQIEAIIDDGLLIMNGKIIAGISAKFEKNPLTAVKRAIFTDDAHALAVEHKLAELQLTSLLIIGTSKKMVDKIAERLHLPSIEKYIPIEQIRTEEEIKIALYIREINGKHTMPIPHSEVEQNFFKRIVQRGREVFSSKKEKIGETTLVSPDFHQQTIFIEPKVYEQVIQHVAQQFPYVKQVHRIHFRFTEYMPILYVEVSIQAPVTYDVIAQMKTLQHSIQQAYENMFHLKISTIKIHVRSIQL